MCKVQDHGRLNTQFSSMYVHTQKISGPKTALSIKWGLLGSCFGATLLCGANLVPHFTGVPFWFQPIIGSPRKTPPLRHRFGKQLPFLMGHHFFLNMIIKEKMATFLRKNSYIFAKKRLPFCKREPFSKMVPQGSCFGTFFLSAGQLCVDPNKALGNDLM